MRGSVTRQGSIEFNENAPGAKDRLRQMHWFHEWSPADDVGTEYHRMGGGRGGDGFCSDVDVQFRTAVPTEATRLTITAPGAHRIDVAL